MLQVQTNNQKRNRKRKEIKGNLNATGFLILSSLKKKKKEGKEEKLYGGSYKKYAPSGLLNLAGSA